MILHSDPRFLDYIEVKDAPCEVVILPLPRPKGGLLGKIRYLLDIIKASMAAAKHMRIHKPACVVGYGGYPSFPSLFVAKLARIPIILHEQNALQGKVNRMFSRSAAAIITAFATVKGTEDYAQKTHNLGNPVRAAITHMPKNSIKAPLRLLITGGSQAARVFSRLVPGAIGLLPDALRHSLSVHHQCKQADVESVQAAYNAIEVKAVIAPFFTNMARELAEADLVIARSGASTVAELCIAGRASLLVPLPTAADDHQTHNAQALADAQAALLMPEQNLTAENLADTLTRLLEQPKQLAEMGQHARVLAKETAAADVADLILDKVK